MAELLETQRTLFLVAEPVLTEYRDGELHLRRVLTGIDIHGKVGAPRADLESLAGRTVDLSDFTEGALSGRGYLTTHHGEEREIVVDGRVARGDGLALYGGSIRWCRGMPYLEEYDAIWAAPGESGAAVRAIEERANAGVKGQRGQLTVSALREVLASFPANAPVRLEGCDCDGRCLGAEMQGENLMLRRDGGVDHKEGDGYGHDWEYETEEP